jgi:hypothetical protein
MVDFRCHVAVVEGGGYQSRFDASEVMDDECGPVRHQRCHPVAFLQSEIQLARSVTAAGLIQLAPRHTCGGGHQRRGLRLGSETSVQQLDQKCRLAQRWSRNRRRLTSSAVLPGRGGVWQGPLRRRGRAARKLAGLHGRASGAWPHSLGLIQPKAGANCTVGGRLPRSGSDRAPRPRASLARG